MSTISTKIAFIDESGDTGLDFAKSGTRRLFTVAAVILDQSNLSTSEQLATAIEAKHFPGGQIKSAKVGKDIEKRFRILEDFMQMDILVYSVVVDKERITKPSGLLFKKSFVKFIHGRLDARLFGAYPNLKVIVDEYGDAAFMDGFRRYIYEHHVPDLFSSSSIAHVSAKVNVMIRVADFFAGSLAKFCGEEFKDQEERFLDLVRPRHLGILRWPITFEPYTRPVESERTSPYDEAIRNVALSSATRFFDNHFGSHDQLHLEQVACLELLLLHSEPSMNHGYISAGEIVDYIQAGVGYEISLQHFRSAIIAKLRDEGVLIASSPAGYKLPSCQADCIDFVNRSNTTIQPMLHRLRLFRESLTLATDRKLDILEFEQFGSLKKFFDT